MTTELSVQEQQQVEKSSRRGFLKWGIAGGLLAVTGLQVAYRRSRNKKNVLTEITIEGPFKKYGHFRPEDLGREDIRKLESDFKLETLILDEGKYGDKVMISFTFAGKEDADHKMRVFLTVHGKDGTIVGGSQDDFVDPRVRAHDEEEVFLGDITIHFNLLSLTARLSNNVKISEIKRILVQSVFVNTM